MNKFPEYYKNVITGMYYQVDEIISVEIEKQAVYCRGTKVRSDAPVPIVVRETDFLLADDIIKITKEEFESELTTALKFLKPCPRYLYWPEEGYYMKITKYNPTDKLFCGVMLYPSSRLIHGRATLPEHIATEVWISSTKYAYENALKGIINEIK